MNSRQILNKIAYENGRITSDIISDLIADNDTTKSRQIEDYKAYRADELPIDARVFADSNKLNNKINNDFRGEIIDQAVGYLFGKPITYGIKPETYDSDTQYKRDEAAFRAFIRDNNVDDLDLETGKKQGVCGTSGRILYIDKSGELRAMNVAPWEMIYVWDRSLDNLQYAMRYYIVKEITKGEVRDRYRVEWYDSEKITFYVQIEGGSYVLDSTEPVNPKPHLMGTVPVVEFPNNEERMSDFKKVKELINAYDRTVSDTQNELEEFRQAYMLFVGATIDKDTITAARLSGAFNLPEDADVRYLTKQINDVFLENHKNTLKDNIYRFAKTIDVNSDTFTGQGSSGEARKWILCPLEWRCAIKQLKFAGSLDRMFQICQKVWLKKALSIDWKNITHSFDRNVPQELLLESDILTKVSGLVSKRTALTLFSPVEDVETELQRMEEEKAEDIDLDAVPDEKPDSSE